MNRLALAAVGLALAGCPKSDEQPPADDRLLQKLQAEKDRLQKNGEAPRPLPGPAPIAEPNPLAQRAAMPDVPKVLPVPGNPDFACGKASCRVSSVETSHSVATDKMTLTSDDYFVRVVVTAQLAAGGPIDLSQATLVQGEEKFTIARDAQSLGGTRDLNRAAKPGEKTEATLYFEVPKAAIAPGLKLVVAGGDGVPLQ